MVQPLTEGTSTYVVNPKSSPSPLQEAPTLLLEKSPPPGYADESLVPSQITLSVGLSVEIRTIAYCVPAVTLAGVANSNAYWVPRAVMLVAVARTVVDDLVIDYLCSLGRHRNDGRQNERIGDGYGGGANTHARDWPLGAGENP